MKCPDCENEEMVLDEIYKNLEREPNRVYYVYKCLKCRATVSAKYYYEQGE